MAANLTTKFRIKIELIFWNVDIKVIKKLLATDSSVFC